MLHDEENILEVNPAVVRILGFRGADEMIGKHPADLSASIQLTKWRTRGCVGAEMHRGVYDKRQHPVRVNFPQLER